MLLTQRVKQQHSSLSHAGRTPVKQDSELVKKEEKGSKTKSSLKNQNCS